jgi:hypothetical protein
MARLLVSAVMVLTTSTYAADESGHTSVTMDEVSDAADIVAEPEPEVTFPAAVMAPVECSNTCPPRLPAERARWAIRSGVCGHPGRRDW